MTIPVHRKKRKTPKVKTGCVTCRQRRIKCDEDKPRCRRCCSTARECGGYTEPNPSRRLVNVLPARLWDATADVCLPASIIRPCSALRTSLDSTEGLALAFFQQHTAARLKKCLRSGIWQRLVLQLAHQERVILDAVIAVSTLHRASWLSKFKRVTDNDRSSLQRFALNRYSRAMVQLRSNMARGSIAYPEHVILISCLLFVCFESLQDSQGAVMMHLRNGLRIIHDVFRSELEFATTYHSAVVLKGARKAAIDDLVSVFSQLDYNASRLGGRSPVIVLSEIPGDLEPDKDLSVAFTSIGAAQSSLDSLAASLDGLQTYLFALATEAVSADPNAPFDLGARQAYVHALTRFVCLHDFKPRFEKRHARLLQSLDQFHVAMAALLRDPIYEKDPQAVSLQLQFTLVHFLAVNLRSTHESDCDAFLPAFQRMVALAEQYPSSERMIPESALTQSFHLQKRVLRTVYLIALKCREPGIRRRAIRLLRTSAFQETRWNSAAYAFHLERLASLEEDDSECKNRRRPQPDSVLTAADIPEEARFCDALIAGDLTNPDAARVVLARYLHTESSAFPKILVEEEGD